MTSVTAQLQTLCDEALAAIGTAATPDTLEALRTEYLGRKGRLRDIMSQLPNLPPDQKPAAGTRANEVKNAIAAAFDEREKQLCKSAIQKNPQSAIDITLPGTPKTLGFRHPITQINDELVQVFARLGFQTAYGPEIEDEYHNFDALNIPPDHPARDGFDTFYLCQATEDTETTERASPATHCGLRIADCGLKKSVQHDTMLTNSSTEKRISASSVTSVANGAAASAAKLLRSHTSPVQIHVMESRQPPIRIIVPGKVFRPDTADASHFPMFHQLEGLCVDEGISFADLKAVLHMAMQQLFGQNTRTRFRPSFFPFTQPSAEVDVSCSFCDGKGCSVCGQDGWIELLGAGMVDPEVFRHVGYDPERYTGFAFGMGIDRVAMLKLGVSDIRLFFENDARFLKQF